MFKRWWLEWKLKRATVNLEKSRAKVLKDVPRTVGEILAKENPDGVPESAGLVTARTSASPLLSVLSLGLPFSEESELRDSIASKILERAELRDGRYYFR